MVGFPFRRLKRATRDASRRPLPRSVVSRVLLAFSVVAIAFVGVASWGVVALRAAADQANLVRNGYLPLTRALRDLVTLQDTWNAQLNHITTARNPTDARVWFEAALHIGRPKKFSEVRAAISIAFVRSADPTVKGIGRDLLAEVKWVERNLEGESSLLKQLFDAMGSSNAQRAERLRDSLLKRGLSMHGRLSRLDRRVLASVDALSAESSEQEQFAVRLLILLSTLTALIGVAMALYVRRVLRPLGTVTLRARDVAEGDWTVRSVVSTGDEIGELASAFETMVAAIATMREQMLSADRLATIGKMAAHVTHEIRNPLSSMALNVELLEDELPKDALEARSILTAVQRELTRLTALTEQYLSIARHRKTKVEPEDLCLLVTEAVEFVRRDLARRRIDVSLNLPVEPVVLFLDEMQFRQALFNLIRNADEAMPEGGLLSLTLSVLAEDVAKDPSSDVAKDAAKDVTHEVTKDATKDATYDAVKEGHRVSRRHEYARLSVEDEGPGIEPELAAKIFEPFVSTKLTGTGLGLAVTRQIVESHGGRIYCEARDGKGARFVLEFPMGNVEGASSDAPASSAPFDAVLR